MVGDGVMEDVGCEVLEGTGVGEFVAAGVLPSVKLQPAKCEMMMEKKRIDLLLIYL